MASACTLAVLIATHSIRIWEILLSSFVVGTAQAFGGPAYSALVPSLVETEDVPNAIALNSVTFNTARLIGPAIAGGVLAYFGEDMCFAVNALSYVATIYTLLAIHPTLPEPGDVSKSMR